MTEPTDPPRWNRLRAMVAANPLVVDSAIALVVTASLVLDIVSGANRIACEPKVGSDRN